MSVLAFFHPIGTGGGSEEPALFSGVPQDQPSSKAPTGKRRNINSVNSLHELFHWFQLRQTSIAALTAHSSLIFRVWKMSRAGTWMGDHQRRLEFQCRNQD
ncbi:uncharacterized protein LOC143845327 isoform X2 [Paroedura picta]|uniref:uncharacterized protein LOC143845327 isoform X2 n=1 Tax=Paroedura picta TaxID=143630 RepID=UPI004056823F